MYDFCTKDIWLTSLIDTKRTIIVSFNCHSHNFDTMISDDVTTHVFHPLGNTAKTTATDSRGIQGGFKGFGRTSSHSLFLNILKK